MYINLNTVPKRVRTINRFSAPNPWNNGQPEEWSTEAYLMVNADYAERFVAPVDPDSRKTKWLYGAERLGIRSESDGRYHMLPESLAELWKTQRVPVEALPRLLREIEPQLRRTDFNPILGHNKAFIALAIPFLITLGIIVIAFYALSTGGPSYAELQELKTTNEAWFARPMREGEFVYGDGAITLAGAIDVPFAVNDPGGTFSSDPSGKRTLGWFRAGREHRLVLMGSSYTPNSSYLLYGVTYSPQTLGIPASFIDEIKTRVSDLNADQILYFGVTGSGSAGWRWPDASYVALGLAACLVSLAPVLLILMLRRKRRRQMAELLARL